MFGWSSGELEHDASYCKSGVTHGPSWCLRGLNRSNVPCPTENKSRKLPQLGLPVCGFYSIIIVDVDVKPSGASDPGNTNNSILSE